jgi:hypothetical protein
MTKPRLTGKPVWQFESDLHAAARRVVGAFGTLPDFLVIGAQRAGTTSLHAWLERHPNVHMASPKEVHFFDVQYHRGDGWYRGHFPSKLRRTAESRLRGGAFLVGESTPYYCCHPSVPARVSATLPDVRLIMLVRNPVDRAFSQYGHEVRVGYEDAPTFEEALEREEHRLRGEEERLSADPGYASYAHNHYSYLLRGQYAPQLRRWFEQFPRERLLVLRSEDLFERSSEVMGAIMRFLELPERPLGELPHRNSNPSGKLEAELRRSLVDHFRPWNAELEDLIGRKLGWDR